MKNCLTCKHGGVGLLEDPCKECWTASAGSGHRKWQAKMVDDDSGGGGWIVLAGVLLGGVFIAGMFVGSL